MRLGSITLVITAGYKNCYRQNLTCSVNHAGIFLKTSAWANYPVRNLKNRVILIRVLKRCRELSPCNLLGWLKLRKLNELNQLIIS